jgi:flagellar protein FliO/FliZ
VNDALITLRAVASFAAVLAVLAVFVWALRRGSLRLSRFAPRGAVAVETAISLGERRSLAIITVEGRRMLIGLTPAAISLITDLGSAPSTSSPETERGR